jgi:ferritin-like metal-binding protein YciE
MPESSLKELYLDELGELYDTETQKVLMLPRLAEAAHTAELRAALTKQCLEARLHLERLQLIFTHWGELRRARRSRGLEAIVQEANERLNDPATQLSRDALILGMAHRIAHYEMAAYGSARLYARWLNRLDDARLLEETFDEEVRADRRLTDIAESHMHRDVSAA